MPAKSYEVVVLPEWNWGVSAFLITDADGRGITYFVLIHLVNGDDGWV